MCNVAARSRRDQSLFLRDGKRRVDLELGPGEQGQREAQPRTNPQVNWGLGPGRPVGWGAGLTKIRGWARVSGGAGGGRGLKTYLTPDPALTADGFLKSK